MDLKDPAQLVPNGSAPADRVWGTLTESCQGGSFPGYLCYPLQKWMLLPLTHLSSASIRHHNTAPDAKRMHLHGRQLL